MLSRFNLAKKIGGGFIIILVLLVLVAFVGQTGLTKVVDKVASANRFQTLENLILDARQNEKQFILTNDPKAIEKVNKDVSALKTEIGVLSTQTNDAGLQEDIKEISGQLEDYGKAFTEFVAMAKEKDMLMADMDQKANAAFEISAKIRDEQKSKYDSLMEESETRISEMRMRVSYANRVIENYYQEKGYRMVITDSENETVSLMTQWKRYHTNIKSALDESAPLMTEESAKKFHKKVLDAQSALFKVEEQFFADKNQDNKLLMIKADKTMQKAVIGFHQELQELLEFYVEDVQIFSGQMMELSSGADKVANTLLGTRILEKDYVQNSDKTFYDKIVKQVIDIHSTISDIKGSIDDEEKTAPLEGIKEAVNNYIRSFKVYAELMENQQSAKERMEKAASGIENGCQKAKDIMMAQMNSQISSSTAIILAASLAAVVFGLFIAFILTRVIIRPIRKVVDALQDISQGDGDLTQRIDIDTKDEIGELARWFNTFVAKLNDIIVDIGANSETVTAASGELLGVSETMAEDSGNLAMRSNSVASAAEEMSTSMNTVAAASEQAATNLTNVSEAAGQMKLTLNEVAQNCDKARQVAGNASEQVETASKRVEHLGTSARDITQVTEVITDIAEQTNLLALNATIEAARAGEAGKGFAVVASEIKGLAAQTADATQNIQDRIKNIQESTDDTVRDVEQVSQVIADVTQIVSAIAAAVEEQSASATEVAENIEQASIGIGGVNENVAQSSQVSTEIAGDIATVNEVSVDMTDRSKQMKTSAKELSDLSGKLRDMIGVFKVSVNENNIQIDNGLTAEDIPDLMPWGDKLKLGIPSIDDQHKELVSMVNELHRAMKMKTGALEAGKILDRLAEYTVYHFGFEEELFDQFQYPELEAHNKVHRDLVAQVQEFKDEFDQGKAALSMELMEFLTEWLRHHIMVMDKAYTPFLKENGVE